MRADAERNRQAILAAASTMFETDGIDVALDDIAAQARVGPGTVHRHFPSKEALYAAVITEQLVDMHKRFQVMLGEPTTAPSFQRVLELVLDAGDTSRSMRAALTGVGFDVRVSAPALAEQLHADVQVLLSASQRLGYVRPELDAHTVFALLAGVFAAEQHVVDLGQQRESLRQVLFAGIRGSALAEPKAATAVC